MLLLLLLLERQTELRAMLRHVDLQQEMAPKSASFNRLRLRTSGCHILFNQIQLSPTATAITIIFIKTNRTFQQNSSNKFKRPRQRVVVSYFKTVTLNMKLKL